MLILKQSKQLTCELCDTTAMEAYVQCPIGKHTRTKEFLTMDLCDACDRFINQTKSALESGEIPNSSQVKKSSKHVTGVDCEVSAEWRRCNNCRYKKYTTISRRKQGFDRRTQDMYIPPSKEPEAPKRVSLTIKPKHMPKPGHPFGNPNSVPPVNGMKETTNIERFQSQSSRYDMGFKLLFENFFIIFFDN